MIDTRITARPVPPAERVNLVHRLFGVHFPMLLEPTIFNTAGKLSPSYSGGLWAFMSLSNGGFYMAPEDSGRSVFQVISDNGFEGSMTADALGITACLYSYSHLSFGRGHFAEVCAEHYHLLRQYTLDHVEVEQILAACD